MGEKGLRPALLRAGAGELAPFPLLESRLGAIPGELSNYGGVTRGLKRMAIRLNPVLPVAVHSVAKHEPTCDDLCPFFACRYGDLRYSWALWRATIPLFACFHG